MVRCEYAHERCTRVRWVRAQSMQHNRMLAQYRWANCPLGNHSQSSLMPPNFHGYGNPDPQ